MTPEVPPELVHCMLPNRSFWYLVLPKDPNVGFNEMSECDISGISDKVSMKNYIIWLFWRLLSGGAESSDMKFHRKSAYSEIAPYPPYWALYGAHAIL